MRQTIAFQATGFDCSPVEIEVPEDEEMPAEDEVPRALLAFESGPNVVLTLPLGSADAESLMNAFTEAEPHRPDMPEANQWQPQPAGLSEGIFWALTPAVVGVSVTPPQETEEGLVPHWTLAFDDEDGSQIQVAVGDPMTTQVVQSLAQVARGELGSGQ
jgi:hypothetical protein